jgi:hypothetical protein
MKPMMIKPIYHNEAQLHCAHWCPRQKTPTQQEQRKHQQQKMFYGNTVPCILSNLLQDGSSVSS